MLPFVFASFCIIWFTIFVMVHIQYPFWNIQPIYHQYDYWRFLYTNPFIVHKQRPWKTKYLETNHIFMFPFEELNTTQQHYFLRLLQGYTLPDNQNVLYTFNEKDFSLLFSEHIQPCYVSFYYHQMPTPTDKTISFHNVHYSIDPYATMYSIPIVMNFLPSETSSEYVRLQLPFHSHPVIKNEKDIHAIRQLFQTHCYQYIVKHPDQKAALFRKQGEPHNGIIPIVEWDSYTYHIPKYPPQQQMDPYYVTHIHKETQNILETLFINEATDPSKRKQQHSQSQMTSTNHHKPFSLWVMVSFTHLLNLIKNQKSYVYVLMLKKSVQGIYFFTKRPIQYEEPEGMVLELTGSISYQPNVQLFFKGFLQGVHNILKTNKEYKYVSIQGNSHNTLLLPFWNKLVIPIQRDPVAYYMYNYVIPQSPFGAHSSFVLL